LTVITTFCFELLNITIAVVSCSMIFVNLIAPMPFIIAQIYVACGLALICLFCELVFTLSVLKILLVTHFDIVFSYDPDQLGYYVLLFGSVLAVLPSAALWTYHTYQGQMINSFVAYLTKSVDNTVQRVQPLILYMAFWIVLCLIAMLTAMLYIPYYIEHNINSNAIQIAEEGHHGGKQVSLTRIMISIVWLSIALTFTLATQHYGLATRYQPQSYVVVFSFNLFLASYVLEKEVCKCTKRFILTKMTAFSRVLAIRGTVSPSYDY
jgi:hypothetical protein